MRSWIAVTAVPFADETPLGNRAGFFMPRTPSGVGIGNALGRLAAVAAGERDDEYRTISSGKKAGSKRGTWDQDLARPPGMLSSRWCRDRNTNSPGIAA